MRKVVLYAFIGLMAGCTGPAGTPGRAGKDGARGADGEIYRCSVYQDVSSVGIMCTDGSYATVYNGKDGLKGPNGDNALPCTVSPSANGATINCPDGSTTELKNGTNGTQGGVGLTGPIGPKGEAGTSVTVSQFCPNYTASYPSTFPEYGLCIGDNLYAVYASATQGTFLAFLPPGAYTSTSNSAMCSFSVGANCAVTH